MEMKSAGTLRDVMDGRIKPPYSIRTKWGYFEFHTLSSDWWVGNGSQSFSCTPDTPVFVSVEDLMNQRATPFPRDEVRIDFNPCADDLPAFLRKQAD